MSLPFTDSRRLTGANLYFSEPGVALETASGIVVDDALIAAWRERVAAMCDALGWSSASIVAHRHVGGAALAFAAPIDQLYTATEINEWAIEVASLPFSPREKVDATYLRLRAGQMRATCLAPATNEATKNKPPFNEKTLTFIRNLRRTSTDAENLIWMFVRGRRLHNQKFRRQFSVGPYVLDFYCHDLKLAVELDGSQHNETAHSSYDERRDAVLAERGIRTLRYWNDEVLLRTEEVLGDIWNVVDRLIHQNSSLAATLPSSALRAPSPEGRREVHAPGYAAIWDEELALYTLRALAAQERRPDLIALLEAAVAHALPALLDDQTLTIGEGTGSRSWPFDTLPTVNEVPWPELHSIPVVLVTGSNGKTTTTRLLTAILEAHGLHAGYSSTDGVFFNGTSLESGDFSGPMGARTVLRHPQVEAAVLETARGGILRRGLAVDRAQAAIVTNISADHFGEYGVHDLDDLADAKLVVARALDASGTLVLNADDGVLVARAASLTCKLVWFSLDADQPILTRHRANRGTTCGVRDGHLVLHAEGQDHDLGDIAKMPLTMHGAASYNIANIAGAVLLANALGIPATTVAHVLAHFGSNNADNPGRLMHWSLGGIEALLDYAHNPEGLRGLLDVANSLRMRDGRLALVLGQAGNREDDDIRALAATAAEFHPGLIVLKDIESYLRGRASGEIAAILKDELLRKQLPAETILTCLDEVEAARMTLRWAHTGDVLVLPIHDQKARATVVALLDRLAASPWKPGMPLQID